MTSRSLPPLLLVVAGVSLWLVNLAYGRPLFVDEANVARNLFDRSYAGLLLPLDHQQYAPPLFLLLAKLGGETFGYAELPLRLPAFAGGLLAVAGLYFAGRRLALGYWALLPLALLFVNPYVLRYVGELKPYAADLGVATTLIAYYLYRPRADWGWALAGAVAPWISLPAVFTLAGIGAVGLFRRRDGRWIAVGAVWLLSFALLYGLLLAPSVRSDYLSGYHRAYFLPLPPTDAAELARFGGLLLAQLKLAFGYTAAALVVGGLLLANGVRRAPAYRWLLLPWATVLVVSAAGFYSLLPRLLLFILPGGWLLAALGARDLFQCSRWPVRVAGLVGLGLLLGGTNVVRHYRAPLTFSDARRLATESREGYRPLPHYGAVAAVDYYGRIHPATRWATEPAVAADPRDQPPGRYALLYDVTTQGNVRDDLARDSLWAVENGYTVESVTLFRARVLYLRPVARE